MPDLGSTEMTMLWLSAALGLVQIAVAAAATVAAKGVPWAAGPRDEAGPPVGKAAARLERATRNFLETFPIFIAAVMMVSLPNSSHAGLSPLGAQLYFWSRLVYVPAYVLAIPYVRTLIWTVSVVGIVLVLLGAWPGM